MSDVSALAAAQVAPTPASPTFVSPTPVSVTPVWPTPVSMVSVSELALRPSRPPDYEAENRALVALAQEMATTPDGILQKLADTALTLCRAHSAGFSLLEVEDRMRAFHWRAIAGEWAAHVGGGTPRDFGPCGTALDHNVAMLCQRPERDFPYLGEVTPLLEEGLLIPLHVDGEAVGTIWVISHDESRRFDAEDLRVMNNLATFAAAAYQTLLSLEATRKANRDLEESETRLQQALAAGSVTAFDWDARSGVSRCSENTAHLLGFDPRRPVSAAAFLAHVHPDDRARFKAVVNGVRPDSPSYAITFRFACPDGREVWLQETAKAEFDGAGNLVRLKGLTLDITERKRAEERQNVLNAELDHRVRNALARVAGVARSTSEGSASIDEFAESLSGRIQSMATAHALLSESRWQGVSLPDLVRSQLAPYATDTNVTISGADVTLAPTTTQALAMVLHELVTNAAKYGALSTGSGRVLVNWKRQSNDDAAASVKIDWQELGGPPTKAPIHSGYGTALIRELIPHELGGTVDLRLAPEGACCRITIPAERG